MKEKPLFTLVRVQDPEKSVPYLGFGARFVEPDVVRIRSVHAGWFQDRLWSGLLPSEKIGHVDPDPGAPFRVVGVTKEDEPWRWRDDRTFWFRDEAQERLEGLRDLPRDYGVEFEVVPEGPEGDPT